MPEEHRTGTAAFASSGKVVALPQADPTHGPDHVTWAYQTHVTAIYQYIYSRVGNRPDAEDLTAQVFMKAISGMRSDVSVPEFFFFQAEDGIRDYKVTGVQTCALPI